MKKSILFLLINLISLLGVTQESPIILEIRESFKKWQPIIKNELNDSKQFFHYVWGENYQEDEWYTSKQTSKDKYLYQKTIVIEKVKLGTFVYYENYSISGDYYITVDYYFDLEDRLYFVFWQMNTLHADEPLTIEKRLYFNSKGECIRNLISTYKMNTKENSKASFADRDVEYELKLENLDFYDKWKTR